MPLGERAEGRARLDRLKLFGIAHQQDFGAALLGFAEHTLKLARADHSGLVDHQHIAWTEEIAVFAPGIFERSDRTRGNARSCFQVFGGDARQRQPLN